jgi:hypothetical protein
MVGADFSARAAASASAIVAVAHSRILQEGTLVAASAVAVAPVGAVAATAAAAALVEAPAVPVVVAAAGPLMRARTRSWSPISRPATARS